MVDWFQSYLCGRRQRISIEDKLSSWCPTSAGVPQGGVLSPLLFAVFINSISNRFVSSYHLYADDLQIYNQAPLNMLPEAIDLVNRDLDQICSWSRSYGLMVNPSKTQVIIVGSPRMIARVDWAHLHHITCDGIVIPYSDSVKI